MRTLLHIDASARRVQSNRDNTPETTIQAKTSISKSIAAQFVDTWVKHNKDSRVIYRDVGKNPPGFISEEWIAAAFTPEQSLAEDQLTLLSESDMLINEVSEADIIVMSTPMYNYGVPAALKAWFDLVIRVNKTFSFDLSRGDSPLKPIMEGKTLVLITSSGEFGFGAGGIREDMNHLNTHVKVMSHYLGIEFFYEINAEYQEFNDERHRISVTEALALATKTAKELS